MTEATSIPKHVILILEGMKKKQQREREKVNSNPWDWRLLARNFAPSAV
jgi:hypothetical protein